MSEKQIKIRYYAFAENVVGELEQIIVARANQKLISQHWTGKIYKSIKEANKDMISLNCS